MGGGGGGGGGVSVPNPFSGGGGGGGGVSWPDYGRRNLAKGLGYGPSGAFGGPGGYGDTLGGLYDKAKGWVGDRLGGGNPFGGGGGGPSYDPQAMPDLPGDPHLMKLSGSSSYRDLRQRATAKGPSAWLGLQNQKIDAERRGLAGQAVSAAGLAQAQGISGLAQAGGLDSGARERLAQTNQMGLMNNLQGVNKQAQIARLNAGMEDERQKLDILDSLMPQELGAQQFNVNAQNNRDLFTYGEQVKGVVGNNMASAMLAGGGGGGGGGMFSSWQDLWRGK